MLASKISCLLVVSLAFLSGALLVVPSQGQSWPVFQWKHIDNSPYPPPRLVSYCENMMRARGMTNPLCKTRNTFIHAPAHIIQPLCARHVQQIVITSPFNFNLVDCWHTGGTPPFYCNYQVALLISARIRITCENQVPVHFNGFSS